MRTTQVKQHIGQKNGISGSNEPAGKQKSSGPIAGYGKTVSPGMLPSHSTALSYHQTFLLNLQRNYGNAYVQSWLSGSAPDQNLLHQGDISRNNNQVVLPHDKNHDEILLQRLQDASRGGEQLPGNIRLELEKLLGADLNQVQVHVGSEADKLSHIFKAKAFTTGSDIFFRKGIYNPDSHEGFHLLAHEASHVVQQSRNPLAYLPGGSGALSVSNHSCHSEQEADVAADRIMAGEPAMIQHSPSAIIARREDDYDELNLGNFAGIMGLANDIIGNTSSLATGIGGIASGVGLVTGAMDLFGEDSSLGNRIRGGMSVAGGLSGLAGTASSIFGSGSLAVSGASGLSATMGAATSAGGTGLASMGAAGLATSAGAVLGAGAAGYGLGRIGDQLFGGLMNITGASGLIDEYSGISRPEGQSGDYSLSGLGALGAYGIDRTVTEGLRSIGLFDEDRPAYTQTLGWRLAEVLPSWMQ